MSAPRTVSKAASVAEKQAEKRRLDEALEEGLEETLAVHRLRVPPLLRTSLASTNMIESVFSVVETVCRNVKHWQGGDPWHGAVAF